MFNFLVSSGENISGGDNGGTDWLMFGLLGGVLGLAIVMIFLSRRRQRRMVGNQVAMLDRIRMGMRVKTVSGVIGRIKEIREEPSGMKTVLIETGNDKYCSYMQVDINAVMEIVSEEGAVPLPEPVVETPAEEFNAEAFVEQSNESREQTQEPGPKKKSSKSQPKDKPSQ